MNLINKITMLLLSVVVLFSSCNHNFDFIPEHKKPRVEYAPQMYHSVAYEPVTQVVDSLAYPGFYNTSPGNKGMNLREPVEGTIKRGFTPYKLPKDSLAYASATLVNPFPPNDSIALVQGELLYKRYCMHCHGAEGKGDGPVSEKFLGIANLTGGQIKDVSEGHIFHVISMGKGRMLSHASQVTQEERWEIARYVKEKLQKAAQ
jgi:mono/diheme cytochrome c family protein